jgi:hypothetical protein
LVPQTANAAKRTRRRDYVFLASYSKISLAIDAWTRSNPLQIDSRGEPPSTREPARQPSGRNSRENRMSRSENCDREDCFLISPDLLYEGADARSSLDASLLDSLLFEESIISSAPSFI